MRERLQQYAAELAEARREDGYEAADYEELLQGMYEAMVRHHGEEALAQMSEETVMKVIRSQTSEVIRLKRMGKLMRKRDRISE